jgi:hypothetical protein
MFNVDKIYVFYKEEGILNLIFLNPEKNEILEFDGYFFNLKENFNHVPEIYEEIDYSKRTSSVKIVEIRQEWDDSFILLNNYDILQITTRPGGDGIIQVLLIFDDESKNISTPLGLTQYEVALKHFEEADIIDIQP